jgi:hypothetical protein
MLENTEGAIKNDNPEKLATGLSLFLPRRYSLTFICPVSCVPYVASFSGLSFFIVLSVFSNIYFSCVLRTLFCAIKKDNPENLAT